MSESALKPKPGLYNLEKTDILVSMQRRSLSHFHAPAGIVPSKMIRTKPKTTFPFQNKTKQNLAAKSNTTDEILETGKNENQFLSLKNIQFFLYTEPRKRGETSSSRKNNVSGGNRVREVEEAEDEE